MIEALYIGALFLTALVIADFIVGRIERLMRKKTRLKRHRQAARDMEAMSNLYNELLLKEVMSDGQN
ncbi:MAG TPA: hypothetical protein IAA48_05975 [Candidatus Eubacterium faecipullorum]|uniref:Uncharacterized protein n=1 Tax=Candidatus Eubacterium faecipullorum TaxID=2838571 RepID=A0A9D1RDD2_9FIRM|nr:hypothetical protein [Candidatus Eubacterium faecipullorum]